MGDLKRLDVKAEELHDVAQAGVIYIPLEPASLLAQDTPSWAAYDQSVFDQLPCILPPAKRSKKKQPSLIQPVGPLLRALASVHGRWGRFEYIVKSATLYIRVYVFLRRHDLDEMERKAAGKIMNRTCRFWDWEDMSPQVEGGSEPLVMIDQDPRSLSELYSNLPSPRVTRADKNRLDTGARQIINQLENELGPDGLQDDTTTRYRYQVNSTMKMLLQERAPSRMMDPCWSQLQENGRGGNCKYWINIVDWQARRTAEDIATAELPRGGLLCEEMGVGKTLISLMLILATKSHFPNPPADVHHSRVVTTFALETFPFQQWQELRAKHQIPYRDRHTSSRKERTGPPPLSKLVEVLFLRNPAYTRRGSRSFFGTRKEEKLRNIKPFYFVEDVDTSAPQHQHGTRRNAVEWDRGDAPQRQTYKKRYITGCTLVVVPSLILAQWKMQIHSHLQPDVLRYAVVENTKDRVVPPIKELVNLDVLLFAKEAFVRESETNSRLLDVHFKRVMYDEGHFGAGGMVSKTLLLAKLITSESRWVITGTPAAHLIGDSGGLLSQDPSAELDQTFEGAIKREQSEDDTTLPDFIKVDGDVCGTDEPEEERDVKPDISAFTNIEDDADADDDDYQGPVSANAWSLDAVKDLRQIGKLFTDFLYAPILESFTDSLRKAASDKRGPQVDSVGKLDALLRKVLIRNRVVDIEEEQMVPPMAKYQMGFELSHIGKLTFNFMQAVVARHVISPAGTTSVAQKASKASTFREILRNMQDATVWYVGGASMHPHWIRKSLETTEAAIRERIANGKSDAASREQDLAILVEAQQHVTAAWSDPLWNDVMLSTSIPLETFDWTIPAHIADAWNQCEGGLPSVCNQGDDGVTMVVQHFLAMRDRMVRDRMETPQENLIMLVEQANEWRRKEEENRMKMEEAKAAARKPRAKEVNKPKKPAKAKTKGDDLKKNSQAVAKEHKRLVDLANGFGGDEDDAIVVEDAAQPALRSLPLTFTTPSTKISWVVHEIQRCPADTFVIFSHSLNSLAYLREALDVAHIQVCHVSGDGPMVTRQANLEMFQAGLRQVCLMELKLAARGLNLVVANRMIFLEPVWAKDDVEAQALKRIHRLGQKRQTVAQTLYLSGTAEEIKLKRRDETSTDVQEINDWQMQDLVRHPRFYNMLPIQPTLITTSLTGGPIDQDLVPQAVSAAEAVKGSGPDVADATLGPDGPIVTQRSADEEEEEKGTVCKPTKTRKRVRIEVDSHEEVELASETSGGGTSVMSAKRMRVIE